MDKYRPCPSIIAMFTSDSQHPPRSKHAVYLGGKSSSICMTARDDNGEGAFVKLRSTLDKVSKRMSLYEYVYVGAVHKSFQ